MGLFGGNMGCGGNNDCCDLILLFLLLNSCGCGMNINLDCNTIIILLLLTTICGNNEHHFGNGGCH